MSHRTQVLVWRAIVVLVFGWMVFTIGRMNWAPIAESWLFLLTALGRSWLLALIAIGLGALAAIPLAAARVYGPVGVRHAAAAVIESVRAIPELMIIFWLYFTLPLVTGSQISSWEAAITALSVIAAAYLAEIVRAGLYAVPPGQREAGLAVGLSRWQAFRLVVLPQAISTMLPAVVAQLVASFKSTSLVYAIGVMEFFRAVNVTNNTLFAPYELYLILAAGYFVSCFAITRVMRRFDPAFQPA